MVVSNFLLVFGFACLDDCFVSLECFDMVLGYCVLCFVLHVCSGLVVCL